jgi:2-polyprenyl-3-methyl-5-hydroxy-6-metoxy-1,4-benzoquinol methylase
MKELLEMKHIKYKYMLSERYKNDGKVSIRLNEVQKATKLNVEQKIASGVYRFEDTICPGCNSANYEHLAEKDRYGLYCNTVICKNCGLLITTPMMTRESLNLFYAEDYAALYRGKKKTDLRTFSFQYKRGRRIINFIKKYDSTFSFAGKLVLEIGCGTGGILAALRDVGAQVMGFDLGADLEYGIKEYGLCLKRGTIEDYHDTQKPDIIIYSHVMEHLPSPQEELKKIKELCQERTLLYIEVPGVLSMQKGDGDFMHYLQNAHLYHFSLGTLNNLLSQNGFTLVSGNEQVRSLFMSTPPPTLKSVNYYRENMVYLRKTESRRHINLFKVRVRGMIFRLYHGVTLVLTDPRKAMAMFRQIIGGEKI